MASISSLIALLAYVIALCGVAPLFPWLGTSPRVILVAGFAAGVWQALRSPWPVKEWVVNAAVVPLFLYYLLPFSAANPVQPVASTLAVMLAVRLAGPKNARHYLQISALALFCLAASSLFDLSPSFLAWLLVMLFMVAVSLVLLTFYSQDSAMTLSRRNLRTVLTAGILMPLVSVPILCLFFPILPRTQLPLWNFMAPGSVRTTGYSDKVEPGASSTVRDSRALAFRAEMPRQPLGQLYWRGTVFNRLDGHQWVRVEPPAEELLYRGGRISQTIYPEPSLARALPALDAPADLTLQRSRRSADGTYEYQGRLGRRFTYRVESILSGTVAVKGGLRSRFYLNVPGELPARFLALAERVRQAADTDAGRLEQLEIHFRRGGYRYGTSGLPTGALALEQFLFEKKPGNCEFFASSFALVLRAAGVPARLVGGYLGGDYNELGGYYVVTEDMAHVWVEAYIAGRGWVRIDPSGFAENAGAVWGTAPRRGILRSLRMGLDSLDHTWNSAVITYDFERQAEAVHTAGTRLQGFNSVRSFRTIAAYLPLAGGIVAVCLLIAGRKRLFLPAQERLLRSFYRRVEKDCGVRAERGKTGLFELADRTGDPRVREFVELYAAAVYRDRPLEPERYARLREIVGNGFGKVRPPRAEEKEVDRGNDKRQ